MKDNSKRNRTFSICIIVFLIFLTLKLAGTGIVADWNWWLVTSPLWIPLAFYLALLVVFIVASIVKFYARKNRYEKKTNAKFHCTFDREPQTKSRFKIMLDRKLWERKKFNQ